MNRRRGYLLLIIIGILNVFDGKGQIIKLDPVNATGQDEVVVIFDATKGTGGLIGAEKVYMHSGVITDGPAGTSWEHVVGNWGEDDGVGQMEQVEGDADKWQIALSPSILAYYNAPSGTTVFRLAMVFRNEDGSKEGKGTPGTIEGGVVAANGDIFMDLNVIAYVVITNPEDNEMAIDPGSAISIRAETSSSADILQLLIDEGSGFTEVQTLNDVSVLETEFTPTRSGPLRIKCTATVNGVDVQSTKNLLIVFRQTPPMLDLPPGLTTGINYVSNDETKVILAILAPEKDFVYVVGDFTNWEVSEMYLMNKSVSEDIFWLEIQDLEPGKEYVFQYWVDGIIKVGDPYADKVADPWNDVFIPEGTYPNLPVYDKDDYGIATVLQTAQKEYTWATTEDAFKRPAKEELIIYELLIRDFLGSHAYKDLADTLSYLKRLGVNAIELMPIMEFEGNESWGYNPSYFFAPDKYYGSKNDLKQFIETAHQLGIAVILDMVLNHAFDQNAMVRMYWDETNNRPAQNNPWFNSEATHPFNVGNDFNHERIYTQDFVDSVNLYWLDEYHFDGFRFDLSKGFTQQVSTEVEPWGKYDQSRVDLLSRMANVIWAYDETAYVILEHFAEDAEEQALATKGMLLWGNMNNTYNEILTNANSTTSIAGAGNTTHVTYMESHDEQRLSYNMQIGGGALGSYNITSQSTYLDRMKLGKTFFLLVPGPKMMWQFQELGYDIDINFNDRVGNKPLVWGEGSLEYYSEAQRQKVYDAVSAILKLRNDYAAVFSDGIFTWKHSGDAKWINLTHADLEIYVIGNFDIDKHETNQQFTKTGTWYDYFTASAIEVSDMNQSVTLEPGEFHIYTDREVDWPKTGIVGSFKPIVTTVPVTFHQKETVNIIFDATQADANGTDGLLGAQKVYMHSGLIVDPLSMEWSLPVGNLGEDDGVGLMQRVEGEENKWQITITPEDYYKIPAGTRAFKLVMFFRDASNTNQGTGPDGENILINVEADPLDKAVWTDPEVFDINQEITVFFDATLSDAAGTAGLTGAEKVYVHSGIITSGPEGTGWENVVGNWGNDDGVGQMTRIAGQENQWQISMTPTEYYNIEDGTKVYRLGMVFRNEDGSREGKDEGGTDFFIDVDYTVTDVLEPSPDFDLNVYPNPAINWVNFNIENLKDRNIVLSVYNSKGELVSQKSYLLSGFSSSSISYSISHLPAGLYHFRLRTQALSESTRIVIIR